MGAMRKRDMSERAQVGEIRFSKKAQAILDRAFSVTNPIEALKQLASLFKGKAIERYESVSFSSRTGRAARYAWRPFETWDGRLWFNSFGNHPSLNEHEPLSKPLHAFLPVGALRIVKNGQGEEFAVQHVRSKIEGSFDNGGEVPNHLKFAKVTE